MCSLKNEAVCNPSRSRIRVAKRELHGIDIPVVCQQCEKAPCKEVCPTRAIHRDLETGVYLIDESVCIGCRLCEMVYPIGAVSVNTETRVAVKCDHCGGEPICTRYCPTGAISHVRYDRVEMMRKRKGAQKILDGLIMTERGE